MKLSLAINVIGTACLFLPRLFAKNVEQDASKLLRKNDKSGGNLPPDNHLFLTTNTNPASVQITPSTYDTAKTLVGNSIGPLQEQDKSNDAIRDLSTTVLADWTQLGTTLYGKSDNDNFGYTVSVSKNGTRMAVGAYTDERGYVKVYDLIAGTSLIQVGSTINVPDQEEIFQIGRYVSMSEDGNRISFLAPGGSGNVLIYEWSDEDWNQLGNTIVLNLWSFAFAMSGNGKRFIVGSGTANENKEGLVQVYEEVNREWVRIGKLDGVYDNENFGAYGVAISHHGKRVIVGSPYALNGNPAEGAGLARVYDQVGDSLEWAQVGSDLELPNAVSGDRFGESVGMSETGSRIVVAARFGEKAVVYDETVSGDWSRVGRVLEMTSPISNLSMSRNGKRLAIGMYYSGGAQVFKEDLGKWYEVGNAITGPQSYGQAVSLSWDGLTIGVGNMGSYVDVPPGMAGLYAAPSTAMCLDSPLEMMLVTTDGDELPFFCKWAKRGKAGFACGTLGVLASHCPVTCGTCSEYKCADSKATFFLNKRERSCSFIENASEEKRNKMCSRKEISDTCRATCGICFQK